MNTQSPAAAIVHWSFLSNRKFRVIVQGKLSMPTDTKAVVPQGSILTPTLYSLCINNTPQLPEVYIDIIKGQALEYSSCQ
jgi:hypothetical protein